MSREGVHAARDEAARALANRRAQVEGLILERVPEHEPVPQLDRMAMLCELMGDPQRSAPVVHLTGTNGKTSTARMVESLLREHGLRTGLFTSPHLASITERIALDGAPISDEAFIAAWEDVEPYVTLVDARLAEAGRPRLSFFEVLVGMAFSVFADAPVDVVVLEVGLGGSWDSTNVADGQVAVVTPVALDHERWLGHDVATIAADKAGIIKPGSFAVLAQQQVEALTVLLERVAETGATVAREGLEFGVRHREVALGGQMTALQGIGGLYEDVFLPLHGQHQAHNAACALVAVEAFLGGRELEVERIRAGFAAVTSPGRLEVVRRSPTVLVDAAHNPAGAEVLAEAVGEAFGFDYLVGVVGVLADKDAASLLQALEPLLDEIVVTKSSSPRSLPVAELAAVATDLFGEDRVHVQDRLDDALVLAIERAETEGGTRAGVLATGSVIVAGEVRTLVGAR